MTKKVSLRLHLIIVVIMGASSCMEPDKGWDITIKGKVGFPQPGIITIQEMRNDTTLPALPVTFDENTYIFEQKVHITEPGYYRVNFFDRQYVDVILDSSDLEINVDGNEAAGFVEVKGSPDMELIQHVYAIRNSIQTSPRIAELNSQYRTAAQAGNEVEILRLQMEFQIEMKKVNDSIAGYLQNQKVSLGLINQLSSGVLDRDQYFYLYREVADKLQKEWPGYFVSNEFIRTVDQMKKVAVGQPAPEIELPNPEGKIIRLSSLRGKYVLVDFWAKWCGPCRKENPNVVRVYNAYKEMGFEVFGVSLDKSHSDWVQAIQEDGLTWTQVSDLKYFESAAARDYNINAIPFSILLDPDGIIVAKNLRGADLEKKVAELLKKS